MFREILHCKKQVFFRSAARGPIAPILFILSIEPLLRDLEANQIHVQSHCDDLAVVATSSSLQSIQDSLQTYERSSGALLNSSKSFLITKLQPPNSPFPTSAIPRRYLGFHLNSKGRYVLPPRLIDECTEALQGIKKLPLSLAGRMTVLSSSIRPRLLYRLGITTARGISSYMLVERWFFSASREFIPGSMSSPVFSDKKLAHPSFHFRLRPFSLSLDLYRLSIFLRTTPVRLSLCNTPAKRWLPRPLHSNLPQSSLPYPWDIPSSAITSLIALIPSSSIRIDNNRNPTPRRKYNLLTNIPETPPSISLAHKHPQQTPIRTAATIPSTTPNVHHIQVQADWSLPHHSRPTPQTSTTVFHMASITQAAILTSPRHLSILRLITPFIVSPLPWVHKINNNHHTSSHSSTPLQPPHTPPITPQQYFIHSSAHGPSGRPSTSVAFKAGSQTMPSPACSSRHIKMSSIELSWRTLSNCSPMSTNKNFF